MTIMQYLEELFFLFLRQGLSLTNSAGGTLTLAFFMTTQRKKRNDSLAQKGSSDSYIIITPIPRLSYQTQTINVLKTFKGRRNSTLVDDEFGKIMKLQASQETSKHAISLRR
jgi:hypothetical protein